jgi:acyl-CoA dehydrogenase
MDLGCAKLLMEPSPARERLTQGMYFSRTAHDAIGRLEDALPKVIAAETLERQLAKLVEARPLLLGDHEAQVQAALALKILNAAEAKLVRAAYAARRSVIAVDDFPAGRSPRPVPGPTRNKRTRRKAS